MSDKSCPFCIGLPGRQLHGYTYGPVDKITHCLNCGAKADTDVWNTRPVEDALHERLLRSVSERNILVDKLNDQEVVNLALTGELAAIRTKYERMRNCHARLGGELHDLGEERDLLRTVTKELQQSWYHLPAEVYDRLNAALADLAAFDAAHTEGDPSTKGA